MLDVVLDRHLRILTILVYGLGDTAWLAGGDLQAN